MLALAFLSISVSFAADLPKWVDRPPRTDKVYRYYVGRSTDESSEAQAHRAATQNAMENAIRENFGVETSINVSDFESTERLTLEKRTREFSPKVLLQDFEQIEGHWVREDGYASVYLLFRYPKLAIESEKARLARAEPSIATPLSEAGLLGHGTSLVVESDPAGAEVFIDNKRWGVTPVAIRGALKPGEHLLSISDPKFENIHEPVVLITGQTKNIHKVLIPATASLVIHTQPENTKVIVDGVSRGVTPLVLRRMPTGRRVTVEAVFDERNSVLRALELTKGEEREITLELPEPVRREPDSSITEDLSLPTEPEAAAIWGIGLEYSGANLPKPYGQTVGSIYLSFEQRFLYHLGIRFKGGIDAGGSSETQQTSSSATNQISGVSYGIGFPIYFSASAKSVYLMPEYGKIQYSTVESSTSGPEISFVYPRKGITVGLQDQASFYSVHVSLFEYDWGSLGRHTTAAIGAAFVFGN